MSYEGYVQRICEDGHYWCDDAYTEDVMCVAHEKPAIIENHVDITNGCNDGPGPCRCGLKEVIKDETGKNIGFGEVVAHDFRIWSNQKAAGRIAHEE